MKTKFLKASYTEYYFYTLLVIIMSFSQQIANVSAINVKICFMFLKYFKG